MTSKRDDNASMELRQATILFADLRGFSAIFSACAPAKMFELLNRWLVRMSEIAIAQQGTIDSFIGDAIMVVFDDPRRALECAVDMQVAMQGVNRAHRDAKLPEIYLGIGVNSGEVVAGVLGSPLYSAKTVVGEEVNLAARIEAFCLRGQILASEVTCGLCGEFAETGEPMEVHVKGRDQSVMLREVHGIPSAGKRVPRQEGRRSPRVQVRIPFSYQLLANDLVSQVRAQGSILYLGARGVLIELDRKLGLFEELKLDVELPLTGYRATDLYGRIVNAKPHEGRYRFGVEFTSLGTETSRNIRALVQLLVQAIGSEHRFPLPR
jgi:adenylate cyclase